ncbi:hypothetical protein HYW55_06550 [Candidatus Gottesmanbacteria bacterium]|nr:hypothetical protein [Candidatus Gottesmanbacteria bacterium]
MRKYVVSTLTGIGAATVLFGFYLLLMRVLTGSFDASWTQFTTLWYFMIPLIVGFGIQVGLYRHLREHLRTSNKRMMTFSSTTSTVSMVACCAHHLTDILPFLGIAIFSTLLIQFQKPILIIGIVSNVFGIFLLVRHIRSISNR